MASEQFHQEAMKSLAHGIAGLFNSKLYSDLEVRCSNGESYACHKLVLCTQSKVFANACDPDHGFEEACENAIIITEEDPAVVKALLEFLYKLDYAIPGNKEDDQSSTKDLTLFHIRVYAAAEFYGIQGLKSLAKQRFENILEKSWNTPGLGEAIRMIYDSTIETDRGLRDVVVDVAAKHFTALMADQEFRDTMEEVGPFGRELAQAIHEGRSWIMQALTCPVDYCGRGFAVDPTGFIDDNILYCPGCANGRTLRQWKA